MKLISIIPQARPTCVEISLGNLRHNFRVVKNKVGNNIKVLAVVKANAYGHGLVPVSQTLVDMRIDYFGVAMLEEALLLRNAGIKTPILIFGPTPCEFAEQVVQADLCQALFARDLAQGLAQAARKLKKKARVHVKVDTGMGRFGYYPENARRFIMDMARLEGVVIEGIYSHFPSMFSLEPDYTSGQLADFRRLLADLVDAGCGSGLRHMANSMAIMDYPDSYLDMVRAGCILYGLPQFEGSFKPVMTLKTKVLYVKDCPKGKYVGYGLKFRTSKDAKIAVLPIGYADGLPRALSNRGQVLIKGRRFPVVGNICMDHTMVDVGQHAVKNGEEAVIMGRQGRDEITAKEIADCLGTFENEIVTRISERVPRIYRE